jgi:DUF4097 and DUF4098 domain-containing protein YvlB
VFLTILVPTAEKIIMRHRVLLSTILLTAFATVPVSGQTPVDRAVATQATGAVEISNISGSIRVVGWDRSEVRVTGTLGEGTERLDVTSSGDRVRVEVVIPRNARNVQASDIEVRVPARKNVTARGVSAGVAVSGVTGSVDAESTSGGVAVGGSPATVRAVSTSGEVELDVTAARVEASSTSGNVRIAGNVRETIAAESVSGNVEVSAPSPELLAKSVSGDLIIAGTSRRLSAGTVSGDMEVRDARLQYGSFESVSGSLRFGGQLEPDAAINVQSHSGDVVLSLPSNLGARFEVSTFSGDIGNAFGGQPRRTDRYGPGQELRFTSGNGSALVTVKTFSGNVELQRR